MKKKLSLLFLLLAIVTNAQIVNIPDANFKAKLLSSSPGNTIAKNLSGNYFAIDANGDGEIQQTEAEQVTELNVSNANIISLNSLVSFSQLKKLDASSNPINNFYFNGNVDPLNPDLGHLKKIILKNCPILQNFKFLSVGGGGGMIPEGYSFLEELDLENCSSLINLQASYSAVTYVNVKNCINLNTMDVSHNSSLSNIEFLNNNNLKILDISHSSF